MNFETFPSFTPTFPALSVAGILHDYAWVLQAAAVKREKRLARARLACIALSSDPDAFFASLRLPAVGAEEPLTAQDLAVFFDCGDRSVEPSYETTTFTPANADKEIALAREINGELTKGLNRTSVMYKVTCGYLWQLLEGLKKHCVLGPLYKSKEILFLLKGSMAQKRVLGAARPDLAVAIEEAFGSGGDNDCVFLINPARADFEATHATLASFVNRFLLAALPRLSAGSINHTARQISAIHVLGERLEVAPTSRQSFRVHREAGGLVYAPVTAARYNVYMSWNDALDFVNEQGGACQFTLLRIKHAFDVRHGTGIRAFGAEVLDVAIPRRGDALLQRNFEHYRDDGWVTDLSFAYI
jgi:hypothetical protein